jgi:hypothetical protein
MGAWGNLAFDNDTACDWSYDLEKSTDLSLVEQALTELEEIGEEYLDQDIACGALAACEVIARLQGNFGYQNAYTESVDKWVKKVKIVPTPALIKRASAAIDRILGDKSELYELWDETGEGDDWRATVEDLRNRMKPRK